MSPTTEYTPCCAPNPADDDNQLVCLRPAVAFDSLLGIDVCELHDPYNAAPNADAVWLEARREGVKPEPFDTYFRPLAGTG